MRRTLLGTIAAIAYLACAGTTSAQDAKIEKGKHVYADQKCSMCHSIEGKGNAKGSLDGVGAIYSADELRQWIVEPAAMAAKHNAQRKPPMPARFASLPKDDLDALVGYLSSLKTKKTS